MGIFYNWQQGLHFGGVLFEVPVVAGAALQEFKLHSRVLTGEPVMWWDEACARK